MRVCELREVVEEYELHSRRSTAVNEALCACQAAMRPALTAQTAWRAGLRRTAFRAEYP